MRTKTGIFDVVAAGSRIKISAGRKDGEVVELSVSPVRALAMYQVLTGRREGTQVRVYDRERDERITVRVHVFKRKGEEGEEIEEGKRILVWKNDDRILALLLRAPGSLALAQEIKEAIVSVIDEGEHLEVGGESFYVFTDASKVRIAYKSVPIVVPRRALRIVKSAMENGVDLDGLLGVKGGHLTVRGKQVQGEEGEVLRSIVEVLT